MVFINACSTSNILMKNVFCLDGFCDLNPIEYPELIFPYMRIVNECCAPLEGENYKIPYARAEYILYSVCTALCCFMTVNQSVCMYF